MSNHKPVEINRQAGIEGDAAVGNDAATLMCSQGCVNDANLLDIKQLSRKFQVPVGTIRGWRDRSVLPPDAVIKIGPRLIRFRLDVMEKWFNDGGHPH